MGTRYLIATTSLIYCNKQYADLMYLDPSEDLYIHWDDMLRRNFQHKRAAYVESGDIEQFIQCTHKVRRSLPYRLFEVDFVDGRWFLFSEQVNEHSEILMQTKELTLQKHQEERLTKELLDLRREATTDELTQVSNRRALVDEVSKELNRCRRSGASMSMLLLDLDYFKRVNDEHGHQVGDEVLIHVAKILKSEVRPYDILGRISGEEFAVFMSNTKASEARNIAERMRASIADSQFVSADQKITLSVSIGTTTLGCDTEFSALYKEGDVALYASKSRGRNCVTSFSDTPEASSKK